MQKIFIVDDSLYESTSYNGNFAHVNKFIGKSGSILNVYPQKVGVGSEARGKWLVVADNGKDNEVQL